ncbi:peroxisomal membrane protein [Seminavis robusta]|uniref:Peroxisomal membrane protein n=1 Tax=Seminavis robusta TaxID=568900 RepID=A0A9N8H5K5_9STRA|nr:peroxisomal membrane protein [Seminavis robusta]|eukprot:Sro88_g046570.1 peroxisomal membrane protein (237) ;mRNA; f:72668-73471
MVKEELHSIASALVGGARYGVKIRLPHALVMTFLFRRDLSSKDKIKSILRLVYSHAASLAAFATIYKAILALLKLTSRKLLTSAGNNDLAWRTAGRKILSMIVDGPLPGESRLLQSAAAAAPPGHPERTHHAFIAGAVGGYFVWGQYSSLNHQILLYLASRVLVGLWKRMLRRRNARLEAESNTPSGDSLQIHHPQTFPLLAAMTWACVMALWEESPDVLHPSLKKSMDEIYRYVL